LLPCRYPNVQLPIYTSIAIAVVIDVASAFIHVKYCDASDGLLSTDDLGIVFTIFLAKINAKFLIARGTMQQW